MSEEVRVNQLEVVRQDEFLMGDISFWTEKLKRRLLDRQDANTVKWTTKWVPWISLPLLAKLILERELGDMAKAINPPHQSMFMRQILEGQGMFVSRRFRLGGRPNTGVFASRAAYVDFQANRPDPRPGRHPAHLSYDLERELIPTIDAGGTLLLGGK